MNRDFRKVALIAAVLGLLVSLFFALRPDDDEELARTTTAVTTTEAEPPATTTVPPTTEAEPPATTTQGQGPGTVHIAYEIAAGQPVGGIARDSVARGRIVVIRVTSDVADHVHLHGYDLMADVGPGRPATIRFTATAPGRFELELEDRGLEFAELEVRP